MARLSAITVAHRRLCAHALAEIDEQLSAYVAVAISPGEERIDVKGEAICAAWICLSTGGARATAIAVAFEAARLASARWKRQLRAEAGDGCTNAATSAVAPSDSAQRHRLALWEYEDQVLLPHLSHGQRAALELHVMDNRSDGEIAGTENLRQDTLRVLRHSAKARLRLLLREGRIPLPPTEDE